MPEKKQSHDLLSSECAVSTVVGAVLILGLLVLLAGTIRVHYVPIWAADAEYVHMNDVLDDMSRLKTDIDLFSAIMYVNPGYTITADNPIMLGGGFVPVVSSMRSSGTISINTDDSGMTISAINGSGTVYDSGTDLQDLGTIRYNSHNNFYLDQTFAYENGALILVQDELSLLKLAPEISISKSAPDNIRVTINAIELSGDPRSTSGSGTEEIFIVSNASSLMFFGGVIITDMTIGISTDFPAAWANYLKRTADDAGMIYGSDYTIITGVDSVIFTITGGSSGEDIQLFVRNTVINVRTGISGG